MRCRVPRSPPDLLLRAAEPTREHYDAAWTLEIIQQAVLAVVLFTTAPLVGGHFEDPRVTHVIRLLSRARWSAFQNIGVVSFRRELRSVANSVRHREEVRDVRRRWSRRSALRNYWALRSGVVGRIVEVAVS